ncbi:hypothetical protein FACS1894199_02370 [Bacteroidia bacterium]|nr:hypothetical protein FACS1894199_02370 [Bacteroidia bacterium]
MKKIELWGLNVVLSGVLLFGVNILCAQESVSEGVTKDVTAKNEGNEAWKGKNYKDAFVNWEKYLESVNFQDPACVYNVALAANKIDNHVAAEKYFDMSIKNNYKATNSYLGKAQAQEDLNKTDEMISTLEAGLQAYPGNDKLEKAYGTHFLKEGVSAQKAKNTDKAIESYAKVVTLKDVDLQVKANSALASLYFNAGVTILQKATPIANTNKELYESEKEKAKTEMKKALDYANKAKELDATNKEAKDLVAQIQKALK